VTDVRQLPAGTELAILAIPASEVPELVGPLAGQGIHHLIVIGGGFAEAGEDGKMIQEQLKAAAQKNEVRVIGPNGLGVFSAGDRFHSLFLSTGEVHYPQPGPVALISQSGAFLALTLDRLASMNIGIHRAINFGNRVDVDENELLQLFANDPAVLVIGLYLESFRDGEKFVALAQKISPHKPIVIWKGGHAERGGAAARAHSSSLAGSYPVFQTACEKSGLIEVQGFDEFSLALQTLSSQPALKGDRILVVSNGGGMGVFLTDICERHGLRIPHPSKSLQHSLANDIPEYYSLENPIDLTGSGTNQQCVVAVETLMRSGEFDALLMVMLPGTAGIDQELPSLLGGHLPRDLPVISAAYGQSLFGSFIQQFEKYNLPVYASAEAAVTALSTLLKRKHIVEQITAMSEDKERVSPSPEWKDWRVSFSCPVDEMTFKKFLSEQGVIVPRSHPLPNSVDVNKAVHELGLPLVLKAVSPEIKHKIELGGVRVGIDSLPELNRCWSAMKKSCPHPIWAEQQMPHGLDLMVGFHRDPNFGPVLIFGAGGQYVEIMQDTVRLLLPASRREIARMITKTRVGKIIDGARGEPPLNKNDLINFLDSACRWMVRCPEIQAVDFNPVRLYPDRLVVLDAKMTVGRE
jgi:acyl-CoA synthetase (NDP forming)